MTTPTPTDLPDTDKHASPELLRKLQTTTEGGAILTADYAGAYSLLDGIYACIVEHLRLHAISAAAPAAPADDASDEWRRLALQFDGHRMQALAHLRRLLAHPQDHAGAVAEFLAAPPKPGELVLAQRIAELATPQAQQPTAPQVGAPADDEDGAAFRKAARLGLTLRFYGNCAQSGMPGSPSAYEVMPGEDRVAAMREAVKRAAAVIESGGEAQRLEQSPQAGAESYPPRDVRARGAVPSDAPAKALCEALEAIQQGDANGRTYRAALGWVVAYLAPDMRGAMAAKRYGDCLTEAKRRLAAPAAVSAPSVRDALAPLRAWWGLLEAQWELCEETPADDVIILHFMGSGASTAVTAGQLRAALSNTASPQAPAGEGGAS